MGPLTKKDIKTTRSHSDIENMKEEQTCLNTVWFLKDNEIEFAIHWKIMRQSNCNIRRSGESNLCPDEKMELILLRDLLSKRTEVVSKCQTLKTHPNPPPPPTKKEENQLPNNH